MNTADQQAVIDFLAAPSTHGGASVERIDTHSAVVFLAGGRARKLKRSVRFDYLDFSTADRRRAMCEAEVRLNRRTAPTLYRGVLAVTREANGSLALDGAGTAVDWVVDMNRFDQGALFDRLAGSGHLGLELMPPLASAIAAFHGAAARRPDHGGTAGMAWVIDGNAAGFAEFGAGCLDASLCAQVTDAARAALDRHAALLDTRRDQGFVRQAHGDLHLRNIVLLDGQPVLFDGVEFNDEIACTDVLYDLAFLLMDLWRRRLPRHANVVWNRYLAETGDLGGIRLLPLFLSCRAAVRAKTSATAARYQDDPRQRAELQELARQYLAMSLRFLQPPPACLVAVGGLSGSGKSTLALALAPFVGPAPGAVVARSDEIRKRLCRTPLLEHLGPEGYSPQVTAQVYAALTEQAAATLAQGHAAIADAVFARPDDRQAIEGAAAGAQVPFTGFWLEAPGPTLVTRTAQRRNDPSDADADVVRVQLAQPSGVITWHRLDGSRAAEQVLMSAIASLQGRVPAAMNDGGGEIPGAAGPGA